MIRFFFSSAKSHSVHSNTQQVHGYPAHFTSLLDGRLFNHGRLCRRCHYTVLALFFLGIGRQPRTSMAVINLLPILWRLFGGFSLSHVFLGTVFTVIRRGRISESDRQVCVDVALWMGAHFVDCQLFASALFGIRLDFYDGLCVGTTQWRRQNVLSRILDLSCPLLAVGHVGLFRPHWQRRGDGFVRHLCRTLVLLLGVCFSRRGRSTRVARGTRLGTTLFVKMDLWRGVGRKCIEFECGWWWSSYPRTSRLIFVWWRSYTERKKENTRK